MAAGSRLIAPAATADCETNPGVPDSRSSSLSSGGRAPFRSRGRDWGGPGDRPWFPVINRPAAAWFFVAFVSNYNNYVFNWGLLRIYCPRVPYDHNVWSCECPHEWLNTSKVKHGIKYGIKWIDEMWSKPVTVSVKIRILINVSLFVRIRNCSVVFL